MLGFQMIFFIHVKHGRILRPGIAHATGTPPSCRNNKLTMTPVSGTVHGKVWNCSPRGKSWETNVFKYLLPGAEVLLRFSSQINM